MLPTEPALFFDCWADAYREDSATYETVDHQCSTDDYIFVSDELVSGQLWFYHRLLTSDELNRFQFASLYTTDFQQTYHGMGGGESESLVPRVLCRWKANNEIIVTCFEGAP